VARDNKDLYNAGNVPLSRSQEKIVIVDPVVSQLIAERQEKAKQSYSDAGFLRMAVVALYVFVGLSLIPYVRILSWGIPILYVVVVALLIRWQMKFGPLVTNDADYLKARRSWRLSFVLWLVALPLGALVWLLIHLLTR